MPNIDLVNDPDFVSKGLNLGLLYHVGIVVRDMEAAKQRFGELFGINEWRGDPVMPPPPPVQLGQKPTQAGLRWAYTKSSFPWLELLQPTDDIPWTLTDFLREKGEGVHHLGYFVDDVNAAMRKLAELGISGSPPGTPNGVKAEPPYLVVYLDAWKTHGVSFELVDQSLRSTLVKFVMTGVWDWPPQPAR